MAEKTLKVTAGPKLEAGRVALSERDRRHPGGEVFVYKAHADEPEAEPVEVAPTPLVNQKLERGILAVASEPKRG